MKTETETKTETPAELVPFPAAPIGRPTRAQWRAVRLERSARTAAARAGDVTPESMARAVKALRAVARLGRLSVRVCELENDPRFFRPDGTEGAYLAGQRAAFDRAEARTSAALAPFALRLSWYGLWPTVENADDRHFRHDCE